MNANTEPPKANFFNKLRNAGMARTEDRWIAGVSGAIHTRTGLDTALIRGLFIIAIFLGIGFIVYGIAWAFLPDEKTGEIVAEEISSGQLSGQFFGALVFVIIGIWSPLNVGGWVVGNSWLAVPSWIGIAVIAVIAAVTLSKNSKSPGEDQHTAHTAEFATDDTENFSQPVAATGTQPFSAPPTQTAPLSPQPQPPPPPKPPKIPRPRRQRPSTAITAAVIGLALIAATATAMLVSAEANLWVSAAGVAVVVLGIGIVIAGLLGKTSAIFSPLAVIILIGSVIASFGWISYGQVGGTLVWNPTNQTANVSRGQAIGVGTLTADLRDVSRNLEDPNIPLRFGVGQVEVIVPNDRTVYVDTAVSVGEVSFETPQGESSSDVIFGPGTYVFGDDGSDDPPLHVSVLGLVGDITIRSAPPTAPTLETPESSNSTVFEVQP